MAEQVGLVAQQVLVPQAIPLQALEVYFIGLVVEAVELLMVLQLQRFQVALAVLDCLQAVEVAVHLMQMQMAAQMVEMVVLDYLLEELLL